LKRLENETKIYNGKKKGVEQTILPEAAQVGMGYVFFSRSCECQQKGSEIEAGINGRI
jgi:hypothetical protein